MNDHYRGSDLASAFGHLPSRQNSLIPAYIDEGEPNDDIHVRSLLPENRPPPHKPKPKPKSVSKKQKQTSTHAEANKKSTSQKTRPLPSRRRTVVADVDSDDARSEADTDFESPFDETDLSDSDDNDDEEEDIIVLKRKKSTYKAQRKNMGKMNGSTSNTITSESHKELSEAASTAQSTAISNESRIQKLESRLKSLERALWITAVAGLLTFALVFISRSQRPRSPYTYGYGYDVEGTPQYGRFRGPLRHQNYRRGNRRRSSTYPSTASHSLYPPLSAMEDLDDPFALHYDDTISEFH